LICTEHSTLWKTLNFNFSMDIDINRYICDVISNYGDQIHEINVYDQFDLITDLTILNISKQCPNLTHLNIGGAYSGCTLKFNNLVTSSSLIALSENCVKLKLLNVKLFYQIDESVSEIVKKCTALEHLNIMQTNGLVDHIFDALAYRENRLTFLNVLISYAGDIEIFASLPRLQQLFVSDITGRTIQSMTRHCRYITHLYFGASNIEDNEVCLLAKCYRDLRMFGIRQNSLLTDSSIGELSHCKQLTYLHVTNCENIGDISILQVAKNCSKLRYLALNETNITDTSISTVSRACKLLKYFTVSGCDNISSEVSDEVNQRYKNNDIIEQIFTAVFNGEEPPWELL